MKSPAWLTGYVESLDFPALTRYRSDCPVCGKKNTFSVTDDGLQRLWYCFHADCNVSGRTGITLTKEHASRALKRGTQTKPSAPRTSNTYEIPDTFVSLSRNLNAELYVKRVQAYDAYLAGRADIRYDFKRNRAVFLVKNGNKVVDATGRCLDDRNPKWYRYGASKYPFLCGDSATVIVCEDCASACSVSSVATGVALLGTNLLPEHIETLQKFQTVYVALDKDATDKAIDMVRTLSPYVSTKLMVLKHDLKNMKKDERDDFIRSYTDR
jgi:DNA primase